MSAWLYLAWMVVEAAPAIYEASKEVEWSAPLAYAMCPRCKTLNALSDWKCPGCNGVLSFDVHRVEGKRKSSATARPVACTRPTSNAPAANAT